MNKKLIPVIGTVILVGGLAFFGGTKYQSSKTSVILAGGRNGSFASALQNIPSSQREQVQQDLQNATTPSARAQVLQKYGISGSFGGGGDRGATSGSVIAKDDKSITVKQSDGSTKIIYYSNLTTVTKSSLAAVSDVNNNSQVSVNGSLNSDGSVTASNIRIEQ